MPAEMQDFPIQVAVPVQWAEMDAYGHVNNAVFFRYFEIARIEFLQSVGFLEAYEQLSIGAILHSTSCRFRAPLRFPDTANVGTRCVDLGTDRFTLEYLIVGGTGQRVAQGDSVVVSYDYARHQKAPLPDSIVAAIRTLNQD